MKYRYNEPVCTMNWCLSDLHVYVYALIPNDPNNLEKIKYEKSAVSYIKTGLFQTTNLTQNKLRYAKSNKRSNMQYIRSKLRYNPNSNQKLI